MTVPTPALLPVTWQLVPPGDHPPRAALSPPLARRPVQHNKYHTHTGLFLSSPQPSEPPEGQRPHAPGEQHHQQVADAPGDGGAAAQQGDQRGFQPGAYRQQTAKAHCQLDDLRPPHRLRLETDVPPVQNVGRQHSQRSARQLP